MNVVVLTILYIILLSETKVQSEFTGDVQLRLPRLFHIDDYDRCLQQKEGIYCFGKFQIYSDLDINPTYELIQEYSQNKRNYNRTFLHRGYCVNARCPSAELNVSARFERCVDRWARTQALRARLHTLHYCKTHEDAHKPFMQKTLDTPHKVFMGIVFVIVTLNIIGTIWYYRTDKKNYEKSKLLLAWSTPDNWNKYVAVPNYSNPLERGLKGLENIRVWAGFILYCVHTNLVHNKTYIINADWNEKFLSGPVASFFKSGLSFSQIYIVFLSFLLSFTILTSNKRKLSAVEIPFFALKKYARLLPINFIVVAFTATWWADLADGPMWPLIVESESTFCRRKFWAQMFFVHNYYRVDEMCIMPSWVLAVEMQLYIFCLILLWGLIKLNILNLRVLSIIFTGTVILIFSVVYLNDYKMFYYISTPDGLANLLRYNSTVNNFYFRPINCLLCAIAGLILGYVYCTFHPGKDHKEQKLKGFLSSFYKYWLIVIVIWYCTTLLFKNFTGPLVNATIITADRIIISLITGFGLYSSFYADSDWVNWPGWRFISRISYAMALTHVHIITYLVARNKVIFEAGFLTTIMYAVATYVFSIFIALPLTILVDYPLQRSLIYFINKLFNKEHQKLGTKTITVKQ